MTTAMIEESIGIDKAYRNKAKKLGLHVSHGGGNTYFEACSKTRKFELYIIVPDAVATEETYFLVTYDQNRDAEKLEDQVKGLQALIKVQDRLASRHTSGISSDFTDNPSITYQANLESLMRVLLEVDFIASCFPWKL